MKHLLKNIFITLVLILGIYLIFIYIMPYFVPFIIAGVLTFFIEPMVRFLQKRTRLTRAPAVAVSMITILSLISGLATLFFGRLIAELIHLSSSLPRYSEILIKKAVLMREDAERFYFSLPLSVLDFIANNTGTIEENLGFYLERLQAFIHNVLNYFITMVSSIPGVLIILLISLTATYFMAKDRTLLVRYWLQLIPAPWGYRILDVVKDVFGALIGYAKAQLILIFITFIQSLLGLLIIGAPYTVLMALIIGFVDLLPILGPSIIFIPWILWGFIFGKTFFSVKLIVIFILIIVTRQALQAKIVADKMGLHPLATLVAIYIGLKLVGVLGLILGPLFLIGFKALTRTGIIRWPV